MACMMGVRTWGQPDLPFELRGGGIMTQPKQLLPILHRYGHRMEWNAQPFPPVPPVPPPQQSIYVNDDTVY